ncbi:MAG: hypothetical protein QMD25_05155 [Caldisericia bacterium]|jgi:hypothetical protein|nr:hypothetical protein [Caldisericia bacterium]
MINKEEIKKLLETIDAFKLISIKGEEERKEFSRITSIWGFIMFLIFTFVGLKLKFLGGISWLYIYLLGAFLHTMKVSNILISFFIWGSIGTILVLIYYLTKNFTLFLFLYVILTILGFSLNYIYKEKFKKENLEIPLKLSISAKVGISWGLITAGMGFLFFSLINYLAKNNLNFDYAFIFILLFGYITSVGIFISGIIINGLFLIGLIGIFGIPIFSLININFGIIMAIFVTLLTSIYGCLIYFKKE